MCLFFQLVFKKLYKNSAREQGTLRYFREKLQRRSVSQDVKHYCEQLFMSVGRCFTIEALLKFFEMENTMGRIVKNRPPYHILDVGDNKRKYFHSVRNKFIDEFLLLPHLPPTPVPENE